MARVNQPDLFAEPEPDLFADAPPVAYRPDPDKVRARLNRILSEARAAATLPWDRSRTNLYRTIVPQMTLWLPDEEAAQWRLAFEAEMARFETDPA
jgi:hypothetical protein